MYSQFEVVLHLLYPILFYRSMRNAQNVMYFTNRGNNLYIISWEIVDISEMTENREKAAVS
ncbi:hypothetical protein GCM10026983_07360 [Gracilibacillus alcaliphilus]